ncbi:MAG: hypothetical protein V4787_16790 [Pseudomonadota bacterium]
MRLIHSSAVLVAFAALAGCAVVPPQAWNFNPMQPQAKRTLPMEQVVALTDRVAQLQIERNEVRARIAATPDIGQRVALYSELHAIGSRLSPLERELATVASSR